MIQNCAIVGSLTDPRTYFRQPTARGEREYVMSRSELMEFATCPHRWFSGYRQEEPEAMSWGSLMDCAWLTPDRLNDRYAFRPETYTNEKGESKKWNGNATVCRQWDADVEKNGQVPLSGALRIATAEACEVLQGDEEIRSVTYEAQVQVMVVGEWVDKSTGLKIPLKCLLDIVPSAKGTRRECLADFKTARSAAPSGWGREVFRHGYDMQAALYLDMWNDAANEKRSTWLHIIQESFAPFEVGRRMLSEEFIELGRGRYKAALRRYAQCLESGTWPGYDDSGRAIIEKWNVTDVEPWMVMAGESFHEDPDWVSKPILELGGAA